MIETEWNVLGALMLDNSLVAQYPFDPEDFADSANREVYSAIWSLVDSEEPADAITVAEKSGVDLSHTLTMVNESAATSNMAAYHRKLKRSGAASRARSIAESLSECQGPEDIEACISRLIALSGAQQSHESDFGKSLRKTIDHLELIEGGVKPGLPTGLRVLDEKLGGFHPGDLIVIAARSQHGKTALMVHMANSQEEHAGIISGEQPDEQLAMRAIAMQGEVSLAKMRAGKLEQSDWSNIDKAVKAFHGKKLSIYDKGGPTISEIMAVARQWKFNKGMSILFVDYLQLVTGGTGEAHRLQIGDVARQFKVLAKQLNIPVVVLAQIKRAVDDRPQGGNNLGRMPYTADLADSAQIEDAADQIITLYRPSVYWPKKEELQGLAYLNVAKNRHGPTGIVGCEWVPEFVQFKNRSAA